MGGVNRRRTPLQHEIGQIARMINVRVGKDDGVYAARLEVKMAIALIGFLAFALEKATFQQNVDAIGADQIRRTGDGPHAAEKGDFHGRSSFCSCAA